MSPLFLRASSNWALSLNCFFSSFSCLSTCLSEALMPFFSASCRMSSWPTSASMVCFLTAFAPSLDVGSWPDCWSCPWIVDKALLYSLPVILSWLTVATTFWSSIFVRLISFASLPFAFAVLFGQPVLSPCFWLNRFAYLVWHRLTSRLQAQQITNKRWVCMIPFSSFSLPSVWEHLVRILTVF